MIFTSYTYAFFLLAAFGIHWVLPTRFRNAFLVAASYLFYCSWKWQFGFLLLGLSLFNWAYARWMLTTSPSGTKLAVGIGGNLAPLLYFKYSGFLVENAAALGQAVGAHWGPSLPNLILPLGISFFTFQGIAYLVDVAAGEEPFGNVLEFLLFKAFWPQLVAGPIIRLSEIRGQIQGRRALAYGDVRAGAKRLLFGAFKKVVLADSLAPFVDMVFLRGASLHAVDAIVGAVAFGLQIYFDFSGYSDIAIGSARLFGFVFPENFSWPYLASSPQQFWNRWHMTLSRWIRDYVFTPLLFAWRGRRVAAPMALLLAMAICGLWHGARWTFVVWGTWHGILLLLNHTALKRFFGVSSEERHGVHRWAMNLAGVVVTFSLVTIGWVFFRAEDLGQAWRVLRAMVDISQGLRPAVLRENAVLIVGCILVGHVVTFLARGLGAKLAAIRPGGILVPAVRGLAYVLLIISVLVFNNEARAFVYFQF